MDLDVTPARSVGTEKYFRDAKTLLVKIKHDAPKPDAIVCLKRSGFILGAYLSNQLTLPLFTAQEIKSIPLKYRTILVVDDKVSTGASMRKVINKIQTHCTPALIISACLYTVNRKEPKFLTHCIEWLRVSHDMFYEIRE
jgi:hypoxanthine phosphoribosyltransferase